LFSGININIANENNKPFVKIDVKNDELIKLNIG
jgi:hypothetical protein